MTSLQLDARYQRSLELHRRIEALYPRIEQHNARFRGMARVDRRLQPPGAVHAVRVDPIVCALAIKGATTKRAIVALCELGDGDNALGLARVLLENACLLEWLIRGEGRRRLEAYVMFTSVQRERFVSDTFERHGNRLIDDPADEMKSSSHDRDVWKHVFRDNQRSDRPTWDVNPDTNTFESVSVKSIFSEITDNNQSFERDVLYAALGSEIIHSGPLSLMLTLRELGDRPTFVLRPMPIADKCTTALAISNSAMFLVLDSLTQYLGLDLSAEMEPLKARWKVDPYDGDG